MLFKLSLRSIFYYNNTMNTCSLPPKGANALRRLCDFNIKLREIVNFLEAFLSYPQSRGYVTVNIALTMMDSGPLHIWRN
jgi:hypothetical protein